VFANGMLYIANKDHLFAISDSNNSTPNTHFEKNQPSPR